MLVDDSGRLSGIFTDSDLVRLLEHQTSTPLEERIDRVMTRDPRRVISGTLTADAVDIIAGRKISELPVVDPEGRPIGDGRHHRRAAATPEGRGQSVRTKASPRRVERSGRRTAPLMNLGESTEGTIRMTLDARCLRIRMMLSDVDGVLTDGRILYDNNGVESKVFHVRDGMGDPTVAACGPFIRNRHGAEFADCTKSGGRSSTSPSFGKASHTNATSFVSSWRRRGSGSIKCAISGTICLTWTCFATSVWEWPFPTPAPKFVPPRIGLRMPPAVWAPFAKQSNSSSGTKDAGMRSWNHTGESIEREASHHGDSETAGAKPDRAIRSGIPDGPCRIHSI